MKFDFRVKFDPSKETKADLRDKILHSLFVSRYRQNKPVITFVGAPSGEGKSMSVGRLIELLFHIDGLTQRGYDPVDYVDDTNAFDPIQFPRKLKGVLGLSKDPETNKRLKKIHFMVMHEARESIRAKSWNDLVTQTVADVNALSRAIKPLMFFVVSQFIKDITKDVRHTITYYCTISRPMHKKPRLKIWVIWRDDRDIENARLRKRRVRGLVQLPDGKHRKIEVKDFEMSYPSKAIVDKLNELDKKSKAEMLIKKLDFMVADLATKNELPVEKIDSIVNYYKSHKEALQTVGRRINDKWVMKKDGVKMHNLTPTEKKEVQKRINDMLKEENSEKAKN